MENPTVYIPVSTPALDWADRFLCQEGIRTQDRTGPAVTHVLLPVPSLDSQGRIRGGMDPEALLATVPETALILGGNLEHRAFEAFRTRDLLREPCYVASNAAITAHCALSMILDRLPVIPAGQKMLILGWGRIGKCLGRLLRAVDAQVTVCARKEADLALAEALGYEVLPIQELPGRISQFRVIVNTVPAPILTRDQLRKAREDALKLELASQPGLLGPDVVPALGLPGKLAQESAGRLIGETVLALLRKEALE